MRTDLDILIHHTPQETQVAFLEGDVVQELHIERLEARSLVGDVFIGTIERVLPGMQSAFVDLGVARNGFLRSCDLVVATQEASLPIEQQLFPGQAVLVQVQKEATKAKGAQLTMKINLAGRLLVFFPFDDHLGFSQKIPQEQHAALLERLQNLRAGQRGGFILRTQGQKATDAELAADMQCLHVTWAKIQEGAQRLPPPSRLHQGLDLIERMLRDWVQPRTRSIQIDSVSVFEKMQSFTAQWMPDMAEKIQLYQAQLPLFDAFHVNAQIKGALQRRAVLPSGGYIVVDAAEAMTVVDVNTGSFVGGRDLDATVLKTNLEAAGEIARQLRLRNVGGVVVVDFINMQSEQHQEAVLNELRKHLALDRVTTTVSGFSALGLVEMTRKRTGPALAQIYCEPCAACSGAGYTVKEML